MESGCNGQGESSGVPRGGPIYLPNMVGPLTTVPKFQSTFLHLLQDLQAQLALDSSSFSQDHDLSIDALKIYTEEELTDMAMKEAFQEDNLSQDDVLDNSPSFRPSKGDASVGSRPKTKKGKTDKRGDEHNLSKNDVLDNSPSSRPLNGDESCGSRPEKKKGKTENGSEEDNLSSNVLENSPSFRPLSGNTSVGSRRKKKKRSEKRSEEAFNAKVEEIAKIKRKQDEDKLTVKLHCLNTCENDEGAAASSGGIERMESLRSTNYSTKPTKPSDIQKPVAMLFPEVVLCIEIYNSIRKSKTQEFLVLGRQMLTELKDKIYCVTDQVMKAAGQNDPSGYFLIENIFCNDLRDPSAIDYSKPILDWLGKSKDEALRKWECILSGELQQKQKAVLGEVKPMDLPHFRAVDMQRTRFCDLRFQLGGGYLYCHQGDCKHMMVIRDMRMAHPEDIQVVGAYPRVIFQQKMRVQKCSVCKIYRASKMAVDDRWAKENPCYFCDYCYTLLHSEEGSLCRDFPVYDYLHE